MDERKRALILLLFLSPFCRLQAMQIDPWLPPLWEFQGRMHACYNLDREIATPIGDFHAFQDNQTLELGLNVTILPYWNVDMGLFFSHTKKVRFGYRAFDFGLRYQWLDDITGDPFSLTTGVSASFPASGFLRDLSFPYHGHLNCEIHGALGKEFVSCFEWQSRIWAFGALGASNTGRPWAHFLLEWDKRLSPSITIGLYSEALIGFGKNNLHPHEPFRGYGPISHQNIDIGLFFNQEIGVMGKLDFELWYTLYAQNFIKNRLGVQLGVVIPFSL